MVLSFISRNFPPILFISIWLLTFALYFNNPYGYEIITSQTIFLLLLSILTVILGFVLARLYFTKSKIAIWAKELSSRERTVEFNYKKLIKIMKWSFSLTTIGILFELLILADLSGGLIKYFSNPIIARQIYVKSVGNVMTGWNIFHSLANYLLDFNYLGSIIGGIIISKKNIDGRLIAFFPLILALIISIITFQRFFFVNCFIYWLFTLIVISNIVDIASQKTVLKRFIKIATSVLLFFLLFSFLLISIRVSFGHKNAELNKVGELIVQSNYTYVAGNLSALDNFLKKDDTQFVYGGSTLRNFFKWFARFGLIDEDQVIRGNYTFTNIGPGYVNTYTYLRIFYEDFGVFGIIFMSFLWGYIGNLLFYSIASNFSLVRLYIVCVLLFSYFLSFYTFTIVSMTLHFYMVFIIFIVEQLIYKPQQLYRVVFNR